jgi:integrase
MADPIKTVTLADGTKRYRFVVDVGRDPVTGKRKQKTHTFDRKKEAEREFARIKHERNTGAYVSPSKITLNQYLDEYVAGATRGRRESTKRNYRDAFRCVRERLGDRPLQSITKGDVEGVVDYMLTSGRKRGGKPGTGLGARSVNLTLGRLTAAFEMAVREGRMARNVAALVEKVKHTPAEQETWSADEVGVFLRAVADHRLRACWRLTLYGLRRGEVLGLRWQDVDLKAGTLKVVQTRVLVDGKVLVEDPKSKNGFRTLPMDPELVEALKALRKAQEADSVDAGGAYQAGLEDLPWYAGGQYVATDELGIPVHPEWYSDEFERVLRAAGLRRIRLHDSRHTALSLMEKAGVPISVISKWAGHYDAAFTMKTYVHARDEDLQRGSTAMAEIHRIA